MGSWLWKDMSTYTNQYSTGTNQGGSHGLTRRFGVGQKRRLSGLSLQLALSLGCFGVDHDSKGLYLSLRYYNNDPSEAGKVLRKRYMISLIP